MKTTNKQINTRYVYDNLMLDELLPELGYKTIEINFNEVLGEKFKDDAPRMQTAYYNEKTGDKVMLICNRSMYGNTNEYINLLDQSEDGGVITFLEKRSNITCGDLEAFLEKRLGPKAFDLNIETKSSFTS